jgi:hypothetical protein
MTGSEIVVRAKPNRAKATVGGVGSGTGLVAIANAIGPTTTMGAILLYLSPSVAYITGAVLYYIDVQTSRFLQRRMVNSARKTLTRQMQDPAMSTQYKARIRRKLEELEETVADAEVARVKSMGELPERT